MKYTDHLKACDIFLLFKLLLTKLRQFIENASQNRCLYFMVNRSSFNPTIHIVNQQVYVYNYRGVSPDLFWTYMFCQMHYNINTYNTDVDYNIHYVFYKHLYNQLLKVKYVFNLEILHKFLVTWNC